MPAWSPFLSLSRYNKSTISKLACQGIRFRSPNREIRKFRSRDRYGLWVYNWARKVFVQVTGTFRRCRPPE